jgi:GAF domain-containing protein
LLEGTWTIPEVRSDERLPREVRELFAGMGVRALVSFPLKAGVESFGQVLVLYGGQHPLSARARQLYELLESQAGLALKRAKRLDDAYARVRLHQDAQRTLDQMQALNAIATTIGQSLQLDEVLHGILQQTLALTGYDVGLISLVDRAADELYLAVDHGLPEALQLRLRDQGMERTLCDYVYREGALLSVSDFMDGAPADVEGLLGIGLRSYLGIPLESRGEVLGTVCVFSYTPYSPQPQLIPLLEGVGRQVGVAIENAQLFERARRRVQRERLVSEVAASMREILDLETVLKTAAQGIRQAMDLPAVTVRLAGGDGDSSPPEAL